MKGPFADFHCDALSKLLEYPEASFTDDARLDVTLNRLREGGVALQCFAVYLSQRWGRPRMELILSQLEQFRRKVAEASGVRPLLWREEAGELLREAETSSSNIRGLLSLEGVDGLEGNLFYAELAYELGVRVMGLTWNYANWAADGVLEPRGGGLTVQGRQLVDWCGQHGMLLDVSHLSEAGFWELTERAAKPLLASHSNSAAVCRHPRNLTDDQIRALITMDGRIGLTFVPWFVREQEGSVSMEDMLPHIEQVCSLGGERHLMFGSDYDGIEEWVRGLEHPGTYPAFAELLLRHYPELLVRGWMFENAVSFLAEHLPAKPE